MKKKGDDPLGDLGAAWPALHSPAETYLIGVSGGRDSVALLHLLLAHGYRSLVVCHLDHGLRGDSAHDARFVENLARQHGLDVLTSRENVRDRAREHRQSLETAARAARYECFARASAERGNAPVFLAHHAGDQVETFLFNLCRGASPGGLGGMKRESTWIADGHELRVLRPLLGISREEIDTYVTGHALAFREDSSNTDPRHTRNRVRHELLPALEELFGRDVRTSILRTAELLRADDEYLRAQLPAVSAELSVPLVRDLPESLQRRLIHAWLKGNAVPDLSFEVVERVRSLLKNTVAKVNLPGARHARRRAHLLFVER